MTYVTLVVNKKTNNMEKINIQENWEQTMPILISILEYGSEKGKQIAREELRRLAKLVDELNQAKKE